MMERYQPMPLSLQTERLVLHLRGSEDAAVNLELLAEHGTGCPARTLTREQARLAEQNAIARQRGFGFFAIARRAEGDSIGYCGLLVGRATFDELEIAYELVRPMRGYGYATEAARAVLTAAFSTGRRRIWATVRSWNAPSLRVLDKLGFRRHHSIVDDRGELVYLRCDEAWRHADPSTLPLPFTPE